MTERKYIGLDFTQNLFIERNSSVFVGSQQGVHSCNAEFTYSGDIHIYQAFKQNSRKEATGAMTAVYDAFNRSLKFCVDLSTAFQQQLVGVARRSLIQGHGEMLASIILAFGHAKRAEMHRVLGARKGREDDTENL
jgi:hypothetical protein